MKKRIKRTAFFAVGVLFIPVGVLGLVLPFLSGILFIAIGVVLLSVSSPRARAWSESHTRRYPRIHAFVERLEKWIIKIVGPMEDESPLTGDRP